MGINKVISEQEMERISNCSYSDFLQILTDIEDFWGSNRTLSITTPTNEKSINFHLRIGMEMTGVENDSGIKVIKDYSGLGQDRVVFKMKFN